MKAKIGKTYAHYKNGNVYTVIAIGRLESDPGAEYVVYRAGYNSADYGNNATWIRLRSIFEEEVLHDGEMVQRFSYIDTP